nr:hypothetical protein [Tanacetum cinerariifolium]
MRMRVSGCVCVYAYPDATRIRVSGCDAFPDATRIRMRRVSGCDAYPDAYASIRMRMRIYGCVC